MLTRMRASTKWLVVFAFIGTIFLVWRSRSASGPDGPGPTAPPGLASRAGRQDSPGTSRDVRWERFTDPNEGAFTIDVPEGWRVQGGTHRVAANDVRPWLVAVSPDRGIELFFGQPELGSFVVPNRMSAMGGFREGMVLNQMVVRRYLPGATFAGQWGARRIAQSCPSASRTGARALPQPSQQIGNAFAAAGIRMSVSAGEAGFACTLHGAPGVGYVFAATNLVDMQNGLAIWNVEPVAGFVASAQQASQAAALLSHVVESFKIEQNWAARQGQTTMAVSRIYSKTQQVVSQSIHDRFQNTSASQAHVWEGWDRSFKGQQPYLDPGTGKVHTLETCPYRWTDGHGHFPCTNTDEPPFPYATKMIPEPLPPGGQ